MTTRQLVYTGFWAAVTAAVLFSITRVESWGFACLAILALALIGIRRDANKTPWPIFLPAGCITLTLFYLIYQYAGPFWDHVVRWQTKSVHHLFQWNDIFNSIPWNDAALFRIWQPAWLTAYMKAVYGFGFTLSYWVCVIRAFFTKDVSKFARYSLAGYLLQVPLILPFYNTVLLQEVWFVQGTPDMMDRWETHELQSQQSVNCFPSMHTSIAFAAMLLVRREQSKAYRMLIMLFGGSIIASTMYLQIHWIIDVAAGIAFAWVCVKLADRIVDSRPFRKVTDAWERLGAFLYGSLAAGGSNEREEQQPEHSTS